MDPDHPTTNRVVCEFVGQPLLTGKSFTYSSYEEQVRKNSAHQVTSTNWYGADSRLHLTAGFTSVGKNTDTQVWISVELDQTFIVKMAMFMPLLHCCNDRHNTAIIRVGFKAGLDQPVCGRLYSHFSDPKLYTIPCTSLIRGTFVTLELHKRHPTLGVFVTKFGAFGLPV